MKKIITLLLSVMLVLPLAACGKAKDTKTAASGKEAKEQKTITVGTSGEYYPWAFKKNDKLQGYEIDVWSEIAKRNNYKIEYKTSKFSGLIGMLDAGKIDTIAHQMSITKERLEKYNFTEPYAYSYYDFAVKNDSSIKSFEDLKGKKVACWLGGNGEKTLRDVNKEKNLNLQIVTYDGAPIEKEVEMGRVEAGWQGEVKTKSTIEQGNLPLRLIGAKLAFETNAYPFTKDEKNKELVESITKTIKEMREDGTLSKLSQKWFKLDTTAKPKK
ncbi:transporter substrate-binding domain-containing protein [Clostridium sp. KNHs214]|uniref:transporter substrate-binding domain-containing protein n=1 Tax=Clostridium sp. KNHs214 TaxID=1540257 RepID=UPI00054E2C13|nr:transporter substrate-binding domain-containing protein [Clostridium sp. KNHs214]